MVPISTWPKPSAAEHVDGGDGFEFFESFRQ
jgi:hypothetical protein